MFKVLVDPVVVLELLEEPALMEEMVPMEQEEVLEKLVLMALQEAEEVMDVLVLMVKLVQEVSLKYQIIFMSYEQHMKQFFCKQGFNTQLR